MGKQVYADDGLSELAHRMCYDDFRYHLFVNDYTPDRTSTIGSFTEGSWTGYAEVDVEHDDFDPQAVVAHNGAVLASPIYFLNSSGTAVAVYGYYVTDLDETMLFYAARFGGAPLYIADGEAMPLIPNLFDRSKESSS